MSARGARLPLFKRLAFVAVVLVLIVLASELVFALKNRFAPPRIVGGDEADDCDSIVILCVGDSMTYGLGARPGEAYPMRLNGFFHMAHKDVPLRVYNLGAPGTNTSEGLSMARNFLRTKIGMAIDYILVLYGVNNRWNLHRATFWEWEEGARDEHLAEYIKSKTQLNKLFKVAFESRLRARDTIENSVAESKFFRRTLDEKGWDVFFDSFEDELLSRWIERDLGEYVALANGHGAQAMFLTYHYERFAGLNPVIRRTAQSTGARLIDIEKPYRFYQKRGMLDRDNFHLNAKGYLNMAMRVMLGFTQQVPEEEIGARLSLKRTRKECEAKDAA